ncbi:hypothetical protein PSPO01_12220 [Paraphaeosphaeria sporulosa]
MDVRRRSSTTAQTETLLHTIIFFPVDYDDPGNESIANVEKADDSISTGPHKHMIRRPALEQASLSFHEMPKYFQDEHFGRVQRRLRSIYFSELAPIDRKHYYAEDSDSYAAQEKEGENITHRFLHQMPLFMHMLQEKGFRTVYARNLESAQRHARRLKNEINQGESPTYRQPKTPATPPATATSNSFTLSPTTPRKLPDPKLPEVMLLTYRVGTRIHLDSRAYDAHVGEHVLLYPSRDEISLDNAKIYDLQAFDAVAQKDDSWRPAWHQCNLKSVTAAEKECLFEEEKYKGLWQGKTQILKRGHSWGMHMVESVPWKGSFQEPACYRTLQEFHKKLKDADLLNIHLEKHPGKLAQKAENHILHHSRFFNYIHQEYVDSLGTWGELRVFIRMKKVKDAKGNERRVPKVVDIIKTHFNDRVAKDRFQKRFGPPKPQTQKRKANLQPGARPGSGQRAPEKGGTNAPNQEGDRYASMFKSQLKRTIRQRKLGMKPSEYKNKNKSGLIKILRDSDAGDGAEQEGVEQAGSDLEGETAVEDEHDTSGDTVLEADADDGDELDPGDGPDEDFFELPDEGPIVRCTYYTYKMNVSRLNLESKDPFRTYPKINISAIKRFAISQYRRLLSRYPKQFESLNVGARLDLGISSKQELFINEVTRWWFASWFGGLEDVEIQDRVARGFAESFAEAYKPDRKANGESDHESDDDEDDFDDDRYEATAMLYKLKKGKEEHSDRQTYGVGGDEGANGGGHGGGSGADKGPGGGQDGEGGQGDETNPDDQGDNGKRPNPTKNSKKKAPGPAEEDDAQQNSDTKGSGKKVTPPTKAKDQIKAGNVNDGDEGVGQEPKQLRSARQPKKRISVDNDDGGDNGDNEERPPRKKGKKNPAKPKNTSKTKKAAKASTNSMESRTKKT